MSSLKGLKLGVALCGSFCTFKRAVLMIEELVALGIDVYPIMSFNAYNISTRFGKAEDFIQTIETITGKKIIHSILDAEPLGPKNLIDAILIAPCTGNTLSKMAHAIIDTPVVLASNATRIQFTASIIDYINIQFLLILMILLSLNLLLVL